MSNREIEAIERDLEATRQRTESTIHALQSKLQPRAVLDEATRFFQGTDSGQYAEDITRNALRQARENPLPLLLIGAGAALLGTKRPGRPKYVGQSRDDYAAYGEGPEIRDGVIGGTAGYSQQDFESQERELSSLYDAEWEETHRVIGASETIDRTYTQSKDEDDTTYQNRLYEARGQAFQIEREDGEDDESFRKRIDEKLKGAKAKASEYKQRAGAFKDRQAQRAKEFGHGVSDRAHRTYDGTRERTSRFYEGSKARTGEFYQGSRRRAGDLAHGTRDGAAQAAQKTGQLYQENPLVAAALAIAAGAVTGALFDATEPERRALKGVGDDINDATRRLNEAANEKVAEYAGKVEQVADKASEKIDEVSRDLNRNGSSQGERLADGTTATSGGYTPSETPSGTGTSTGTSTGSTTGGTGAKTS